jgi:hypothetical protein
MPADANTVFIGRLGHPASINAFAIYIYYVDIYEPLST